MTGFDAGSESGERRPRRGSQLPPYAPPAILSDLASPTGPPEDSAVVPDELGIEAAASTPVQSREAAEETDAFAGARGEGTKGVRWPAAEDDATSAVLMAPGTEADPATAELLVVATSAGVARGASAIPGAAGPAAAPATRRVTPAADIAAERGRRRERDRQARTRLAAATLAATQRRPRFRDDPVRGVLLGLGELFITVGVLLGLFVVYELWITDLLGGQKQQAISQQMEQRWSSSSSAPAAPAGSPAASEGAAPNSDVLAPPPGDAQVVNPADRQRKYTTATGQGFANLYIPVFGADYVFAVVEGTTTDDLYGNPGHYDDTQYPGELGNFAVAGHRVSKGSPFNALDTLNACDAIVIETQDEWFVYRVLPMADEAIGWNPASRPECADVQPLTGEYDGVVGREIVDPSDYAQVLPVPHVDAVGPAALAAADQRLITLTTCHPQFSDAQRMIIHGVLTKTYAKAPGFLPPELAES